MLSFSANDANGTLQSTSVTLSATNAYDVDMAVEAINRGLQKSGNATLKNIIAVKETNAAGTAEGIRFISSLNNFSVNVGPAVNNTAETPVGLYDGTTGAPAAQGISVASSASGAIDISSSAGAKQAVIVLGGAVQKLGSAQAAIGKGQNQLGYAINLAQLADQQLLLRASADSRCRCSVGSGESEQGPGPAAGFDRRHGPGQFRSSGGTIPPEGVNSDLKV